MIPIKLHKWAKKSIYTRRIISPTFTYSYAPCSFVNNHQPIRKEMSVISKYSTHREKKNKENFYF